MKPLAPGTNLNMGLDLWSSQAGVPVKLKKAAKEIGKSASYATAMEVMHARVTGQKVRSRGLEGDHGTWDEFMKSKHPDRSTGIIHESVLRTTMRPTQFTDYSIYSRWQILVKTTLSREDYPLDYFLSPPFEDWVVTGIGRNKSGSGYFENIDAISLCCEMVLSQDESEAHSVRVVAINSDFKVILDELFTPCHEAVQHLENASHTLSLADIQEKLLNLLSVDTIVVGHSLKLDLQALKLDHTKVLDTSQVFKYEYSGVPPKENNGYFETCIEFESIQPRRPSLDFLCKSILGYEEPPNNCLQKAEATMKLARAVVKKGAKTSIPLTDEMLASEKSTLFIPEEKIKRSKKLSPDS
ncbi:hypothetical protein HID58_078767 [Brassica napus]|uniref:Exonuclease domain-containing protein n=1 Tax=Brassica napus TaxID=3708 RepID=A0ABQ7YUZ9_BRANA|nr:hypothetical protein HID58_078767 [Brassica napus]